jgi:hypothetical protein
MDTTKIRIILQALPLVIPLNIYMFGDWLGTGLQWALVRYQQSYLGTSIIPLNRDLTYVLSGIMTGRSGVSIVLWFSAALLLMVTLALVLYNPSVNDAFRYRRFAPHLTILAGILFLFSCMFQYGISLYGVAGFSIPLGIPVIILIGYWTYRMDCADVPADAGEVAQEEPAELP